MVPRIVGEAFGRVFAVEAPELLHARLETLLPWSWAPSSHTPERVWRISETEDPALQARACAYADQDLVSVGISVEDLLEVTARDLELWVAEHAASLIFVHAGVVAWQGRAIVIPGLSRAGKSTLVSSLLDAGATYFSDEFAPIGPDGLVHPYPRPLSLRHDGADGAWDAEPPPPEALSAVPLGVVAEVTYSPEPSGLPEPTSQAAAVMGLLRNTVCATSRGAEALDVLVGAVATSTSLRGSRGEADDFATYLLSRNLLPA